MNHFIALIDGHIVKRISENVNKMIIVRKFFRIASTTIVIGACTYQINHENRPNIILILVDDLGYGGIGCCILEIQKSMGNAVRSNETACCGWGYITI